MNVFQRAGWLGLAIVLWCASAPAMPLRELNAQTQGKIAHLSVRDANGEEESSGSGFVISNDGRIATNYHVIDDASQMVAVFPDREVKITGVWAFDKEVDLAILQLAPGKYESLELAQTPAVEGEDIVVIGSPLGLSNAISTGIVSAVRNKGIEKTFYRDGEANWSLQLTAAASHGSSGSPILRTDGQVIGVIVGLMGGLEGASFGIAVDKLIRLNALSAKKPTGFPGQPAENSVTKNLLISLAVFAALALIWLAATRFPRRPRRS